MQEKHCDAIEKTLRVFNVPEQQMIYLDYCGMLKAENTDVEKMIQSQDVWNVLGDEQSKMIYKQGTKYRLTEDYSYFLEHIGEMFEDKDVLHMEGMLSFAEWSKERKYAEEDKRIALYVPNRFWLGFAYPRLKEMGVRIDCICTDNEEMCNKLLFYVPTISLETAAKYLQGGHLIIGTGMKQFTMEVEEKLSAAGFRKEQIVAPCCQETMFNYGRQYFSLDLVKPVDDEVFIDVGCLSCETDLDFIDWNKGRYEHIYAFEPDAKNYERCLGIIERNGIENITLVNKGLWDCKTKLCFESNINPSLSKIQDVGEEVIETITLDEFLDGKRATFIKMDIEGAEMEALRGAAETIKQHKPRLAISIYHKVNDFIDIPEYLLSLVPEYKFYIRHYSCYKFETILYALI